MAGCNTRQCAPKFIRPRPTGKCAPVRTEVSMGVDLGRIIIVAIALAVCAPSVLAAETPEADYSSFTQLIRDLPPGVSKNNPIFDATPYIGKRVIVKGTLSDRYSFGSKFIVAISCHITAKYSVFGEKKVRAEFDPNDETVVLIEGMKPGDRIEISGKIKEMSSMDSSPFLRLSDCILLRPLPRPKTP